MVGQRAPRSAAQPRYKQIAEWIRDGIRSGRLRAGDAIPSQQELADLAQVQVGTAARAVSLLMREGLVIKRVRGTRAQVASDRVEILPPARASTTAIGIATPLLLRAKVVRVDTDGPLAEVRLEVVADERFAIALPAAAAIALGIEPGRSLTVELLTRAVDLISGMS